MTFYSRAFVSALCLALECSRDTSFVEGFQHSSSVTQANVAGAVRRIRVLQQLAATKVPGPTHCRRYNCRIPSSAIYASPTFEDINEASEVAADAEQPSAHSSLDTTTDASTSNTDASEDKSLFSDIPLTAVALLNVVAIIWGTQHAVIKTVVDDCDPSAFSFARFGLAAGLVLPYVPSLRPVFDKFMTGESDNGDIDGSTSDGSASDDADLVAWRWGLEMGFWMFCGYAFQAIGLLNTTAQRSGFLLYLNVKFVPFFARILFGREISIPTWASAFTALLGTALLSFDGTSAALNVGDIWSIAAAAASAIFILRLESASAAVPDSSALNAACLSVVTAGSLVWTIGETFMSSAVSDMNIVEACRITLSNVAFTVQKHPFALIYLGGVTTALANYIQTKAQKGISAERASIIYAMDPVYGAIFSNLLLGETLSSYGMVGAGIITVAAATNAFLDLGVKSDVQKKAIGEADDESHR